MSLATELEKQIPRLRRFARAATADADLADACLERALEGLLDDPMPSSAEQDLSNQVRLYRAVEQILEAEAQGSFQKQAWRALILVFVEEFSVHEAGSILGVDAGTVRKMVESAEHQVRDRLKQC